MKWYTHAAVGANVAWLVPLFVEPQQWMIFYVILGAFAALLPDIDAGWMGEGAKIHYVGGGIFGLFKGVFRHRGFFHSFLCITLLFCALIPAAFLIDPFVPLIVTAGYASHLLIDCWNGGMQWFYPLHKDVTFVPAFFQCRVGSAGDFFFFLAGVMGVTVFILTYLPILTKLNI